MISKQQAKFIKSLKLKKYRRKASAFLVEGAKNVSELVHSDYDIQHLLLTEKFLSEKGKQLPDDLEYTLCDEKELVSMGTFQSNEYALAVASFKNVVVDIKNEKLIIALDEINDPGNLGTVIRTADWYGVKSIIASEGTADFYNPKIINTSIKSFTKVSVTYMELNEFFEENPERKVYGAFLDGKDIHSFQPEFPATIVMGSEANGISGSLNKYVTEKITIPRLGKAESLNVAVSTAVILDNLLKS